MFRDGTEFLAQLRHQLSVPRDEAEDIVRELRDHIEDRIEALTARGLTHEEATRIVMRGFGAPHALAFRLVRGDGASPLQVILGALPPLLCGAMLVLHVSSSAVGLVALGVLAAGFTVVGFVRDRPPWFYSWAGLCLSLLILFGYIAFLGLKNSAPAAVTQVPDLGPTLEIGAFVVYVPLATVLAGFLMFVAVRRDWTDASLVLSPLPAILLVMKHLHGEAGNSIYAMSYDLTTLCLLAALATACYLAMPTRMLRIVVMVLCSLLLPMLMPALTSSASLSLIALLGQQLVLLLFLLSPWVLASQISRLRLSP